MHDTNSYARRYHWFSQDVRSFVDDPHAAIAAQATGDVWNLVFNYANFSYPSNPNTLLILPLDHDIVYLDRCRILPFPRDTTIDIVYPPTPEKLGAAFEQGVAESWRTLLFDKNLCGGLCHTNVT